MNRTEESSSHPEEHLSRSPSQEADSEEQQMEEVSSNGPKIEELQDSLERLREFVKGLPQDKKTSVPACVEEYCDKMDEYRVGDVDSVLKIAQRRVNKMMRNRKIKRNWNNEDITLLVWTVCRLLDQKSLSHFSELKKQDWQLIASLIAGSTWQKCKFRWLGLKKVKLLAHKWSKIESRLLSQAVADQQKPNWKTVAQHLYENNTNKNKVFRTPKQCREHWNCFLNPAIQKGPWSLQEDRKLLEYVLELEGSKKWSEISKFMEGRTENALKNRFNLLLGRQRKVYGHITEKRLVKTCLNKLMLEQGQQERVDLPSDATPLPKSQEPVQSFIPEHRNRLLSIPSGQGQAVFGNCNSSFRAVGYESVIGYLGGGLGSGVMTGEQAGHNPIYLGFLLPTTFM